MRACDSAACSTFIHATMIERHPPDAVKPTVFIQLSFVHPLQTVVLAGFLEISVTQLETIRVK